MKSEGIDVTFFFFFCMTNDNTDVNTVHLDWKSSWSTSTKIWTAQGCLERGVTVWCAASRWRQRLTRSPSRMNHLALVPAAGTPAEGASLQGCGTGGSSASREGGRGWAVLASCSSYLISEVRLSPSLSSSLSCLLLWRYSRPAWTRSCAACCRWPCFGRGFGPDDPQRSLPAPAILWYCDGRSYRTLKTKQCVQLHLQKFKQAQRRWRGGAEERVLEVPRWENRSTCSPEGQPCS